MKMSKRMLKPAVTLFVLSAIVFLGSLWPPVQSATGPSQLKIPRIPISLEIGRKKKGKCEFAFGICKITIGIASVAGSVKAELTTAAGGKLQLTLLEKAPGEGRTLFVDEDIPLSSEIAQKLGLRDATIRKGQYAFSESKSVLSARLGRRL